MTGGKVSRRELLKEGALGLLLAAGLGGVAGYLIRDRIVPQPQAQPRPGVEIPPFDPRRVPTVGILATQKEAYFFFDIVGLHIPKGSWVSWIDAVGTHSTTAYHPANGKVLRIPEGAEPWNSGVMSPGQSFAWKFEVEGIYDYYCIPHEMTGMVGRIVVGEPTEEPKPQSEGIPPPARILPSVEEILKKKVIRFEEVI